MRVLLFTGKGGVGKTTAAAATALRLADRGAKTLLLSTDTAHSLADALGAPLHDDPTEVASNLWVTQLDTQGRLEAAWRDVQAYLIELLARGGVDPITADELTVLPGVDEVLALLAVREFAAGGSWDALVVDCAPTAETLRLLALPEALGWYLQRVFPVQRRIARGVRTFATLLGRADAVPPDAVFDALLRLSDELAAVRQLLADPATASVRLVLTPESMVVAEARRTFTALSLYGYRVDAVLANRVFADGGDEWRRRWAGAQRAQLERVHESFAAVPVHEVAYQASEPVGVSALRAVADELYGVLPGDDPAPPVETSPPPLRMSADADGGYELSVALPLAQRDEVDAVRVGDDLVVSVGVHRRVFSLPSMLRRCTVVGGSFDGEVLRVRFGADPEAATPRSRPRPTPGGRADGGAAHD